MNHSIETPDDVRETRRPFRVFLIRHALSAWGAEHRWAGQADPPLAPQGEKAAHEVGVRLHHGGFQSIWSSPLRRALQTAEIVGAQSGLGHPRAVPKLVERDAGEWTGKTSPEIIARYPGQLEAWRAGEIVDPPGSESWDSFTSRVLEGLVHLDADGQAAVVVHQGVIRAVQHASGAEPSEVNGVDGLWVQIENGQVHPLTK